MLNMSTNRPPLPVYSQSDDSLLKLQEESEALLKESRAQFSDILKNTINRLQSKPVQGK